MIEIGAGFIYSIGKDLWNFITRKKPEYAIKEKQVNFDYLEAAGLNVLWKNYELRWTALSKVEIRKLKGWKIMYEVDQENKIKFSLKNKDTILMGKLKN